MCTPTPLLVLFLCAGVAWSEAQSPNNPLGCTNKEDCLRRFLLVENDLNMVRDNTANLIPKDPNNKQLNTLLDLYQRKYLDSKRDVKNFQTQGWK